MKPALMVLCAMCMAGPATAERLKSAEFIGDFARHPVVMQPRSGSGAPRPAMQVWASVSTLSGAVPDRARLDAAAGFAAKAGCRSARILTTVLAGVTETSAEFEILCEGEKR